MTKGKGYNYRAQNCCVNCEHSIQDEESHFMICKKGNGINERNWVDDWGICDEWKEKE